MQEQKEIGDEKRGGWGGGVATLLLVMRLNRRELSDEFVSGKHARGITPYFSTTFTSMCHWPPSSDGFDISCATTRPSAASPARALATNTRSW